MRKSALSLKLTVARNPQPVFVKHQSFADQLIVSCEGTIKAFVSDTMLRVPAFGGTVPDGPGERMKFNPGSIIYHKNIYREDAGSFHRRSSILPH